MNVGASAYKRGHTLMKQKLTNELDAAYREMAADIVREKDALAWSNTFVEDVADDPDKELRGVD